LKKKRTISLKKVSKFNTDPARAYLCIVV